MRGTSNHYDAIAGKYDAEIDTAHNRMVRQCFWQCVESELREPSRILDFGAGTGLDAEHFAALGHFVAAYDNSDGMLGILRERCRRQIDDGSVVPVGGALDEATAALGELAPFDAVISNFAVFSTVDHLQPVFALFSRVLKKGGFVLILIQNPWDVAHLRTRAFWTSLLRTPFQYESAELGRIRHRTASQIIRAAAGDFVMSRRARAVDRACFGRGSHFKLVELTRR